MNVGKSIRITLYFLLLINCGGVKAQEKFISYGDFELAYGKDSDLRVLDKEFDLLFVLLLDPIHKQQFFKYNLELVDLFEGYSYGLKLNKSTVGFVTQVTDIKMVFESKLLMNKVFNCISVDEISTEIIRVVNYPIYVKDNTAVVEVLTGDVLDTYYFRLYEGVVQINWLGGVVE